MRSVRQVSQVRQIWMQTSGRGIWKLETQEPRRKTLFKKLGANMRDLLNYDKNPSRLRRSYARLRAGLSRANIPKMSARSATPYLQRVPASVLHLNIRDALSFRFDLLRGCLSGNNMVRCVLGRSQPKIDTTRSSSENVRKGYRVLRQGTARKRRLVQ